MARVLESLIAKGRRARRPREQKEVAFGLADLSTHGTLLLTTIGCSLICIRRGAPGKNGSKGRN